MTPAIELQFISKILTSQDEDEINTLCSFDTSYYSVFKEQITFILEHRSKYQAAPDVFTFKAEFPDVVLVDVKEPMEYLIGQMKLYKQQLLLIETFNKVKDLGNADAAQAWEYVETQYQKAMQLDDCAPLDLVSQSKERAEEVERLSKQTRIPTGFAEIDKVMYGGLSTVEELLLIIARTNNGKAQPLWSKVLTPTGWTTMGELKVGDVVVGENNDNGRIVQIFPQGIKDYYRIHFDDGTYAECCDDHLWKVLTGKRRERANRFYEVHQVLTTKDIRESLDAKYSVDISNPIEFESQFDENVELDGYLLGVIIGDGGLRDGTVTISNESEEIWKRVEAILPKYNCVRSDKRKDRCSIVGIDPRVNYVKQKLVEYGLMNKKSIDKFIPKQYLTAPIHVRKALLAGLVDTDGYASKASKMSWEFDTASELLAADFIELAESLGVWVKSHDRQASFYTVDGVRHDASGSRHINCRSNFNPFRLSSKAARYECRTVPFKHSMPKRHCKMIRSVEYVGKTECQCILLDNHSHTYITDHYTVTHNTWIATKMMESAQKNGFPVLYYSPEMQGAYLGTRFDTWRTHMQSSQLFLGKYTDEYWKYLDKLSQEETAALVLEDKHTSGNEVNVRVLENLVKKYGIKLLIIDGLSYMTDTQRSDTDYIKYKNICAALFKLSKQHGCAVVVVVQANRETKDCKDDKGEPMPNLYNIEGSDHPARICTQAFSIRQIFDKHVLDIRLEKSRNANNQRPIFSYSWDINTGNMQYLPSGDAGTNITSVTPTIVPPTLTTTHVHNIDDALSDDSLEGDDDIEF